MSDTATAQLNYTTINHEAREKFNLNLEEYCVADLIHNLSHNPRNTVPGWCHASKPTMAKMIGIGRASIFRHIKKLLALKLITQNPDQPALLKSTDKWYDNVIMKSQQPNLPLPSQNETTRLNLIPYPSQNETTPPSQNETVQGYIIQDKDIYKEQRKEEEKKVSWTSCPLHSNNFQSLKAKYPDNDYSELSKGHKECEEYLTSIENTRRRGFPGRIKQLFALHNILEAGFSFADMDRSMIAMDKKYGSNKWDLLRMERWLAVEGSQKGAKTNDYSEDQLSRPRGSHSLLDSIV